ncbi:uncharacterized protein N7458_005690 [Penicillium daleae]|uniref:Uncharacterized protein n=1 Tax=Penicillium daleae TaxID=63821 RepID=A0AAD6G506_9EURO|nr:uncharacterized protein N7458_005690 [Penicillium daleae]KAJ5454734.1 hypothetical protein N7458_005690 [Penicillium daleae]
MAHNQSGCLTEKALAHFVSTNHRPAWSAKSLDVSRFPCGTHLTATFVLVILKILQPIASAILPKSAPPSASPSLHRSIIRL